MVGIISYVNKFDVSMNDLPALEVLPGWISVALFQHGSHTSNYKP